MDEPPGSCAFAMCSRAATVLLALLVEEEESILAACERHADWLRGYVREDDAVRVMVEMPLMPGDRFAAGDLADPA